MPGVLGKDPKVPLAGRSKEAVPLVFGVPVMAPVDVFKLSPAGKEPEKVVGEPVVEADNVDPDVKDAGRFVGVAISFS